MTKSENLTYDDVRNASLAYFNNDQLAAEVFAGKYALKLPSGAYTELTPTDMHERLAREFYRVESKYPNPMSYAEIFDLFSSFDPVTGQRGMGDVIPQGSPMSAVGNIHQFQSLSNCFVIEPPYDSYGGIMKTDQEQAQLMKRRGGVGFDISTIRPRGLLTANAASTTDGIGVFMERFSNTCREVAQGGRRGALMLSVSVHHPEIRTFINIKRDKKKVTGANISIRLTDEFMNAVKHGETVQLRFPVEKEATHQISNDVDARELWSEIIEAAHACAEPGLLFWDTILGRGPADVYPEFRSTSTNPCIVGDTLIAVADGRVAVSIKQLAEEGQDTPVYSTNIKTGQVEVKIGRNPRLTKSNTSVWELVLDNGSSLLATPDHKVLTSNLEYVELQNLQVNDSLAGTGSPKVVSVQWFGTADVFNLTVDANNNYKVIPSSNTPEYSICVKNCGEITLNSNDSCRLMLVNLYRFVDDPFTSKARFNYSRFDDVVQKAQRLMDNMIDLELECIDRILAKVEKDPEPEDVKNLEVTLWHKIRSSAVRGRRTGLGITALGDALAALGIRYGSDESVTATHDIYRALAMGAYRSSVQMAEERGAFPAFDLKIEHNHPFLRQIMAEDPELETRYFLHGRRNIGLTTTAPAGSVSILTQSTSGCEPVFKLSYTRRKKHNPNDQDAKIDFVDDLGDKWQHYTVFHHGVKTWMEVTGNVNIEESPYWKATSEDIDWVKKIDIQAAAQKWICHSISNTTNIPNDTTVDTVKQIYMRGWESGCKGVTIYREGSRDGVMFSESSPTEVIIVDTDAPKRPKTLNCDIHRANVKGESYLVVVGRLTDRPYELFCGLSLNVEIPKRVKEGRLVKNGKNADGISLYNLEIPIGDDDQLVIKDIVTVFDNPIYGAFTRTISLALRHGVPVKFLVEQLRKDKHSDMWSFNTVIARVLSKHYIPDGTKTTAEKHCKECKSTELSYQQGCVTCMTCGSSKCS